MQIKDIPNGSFLMTTVVYKESVFSVVARTEDGKLISFECDATHVSAGTTIGINKHIDGTVRLITHNLGGSKK